jgi:hypothetical protein
MNGGIQGQDVWQIKGKDKEKKFGKERRKTRKEEDKEKKFGNESRKTKGRSLA